MKTTIKALLVLLTITIAPLASQAKKVQPPCVYIFGFSASFQDSVVYMTDVQAVKGAWIESKSKFLLGREHYSRQLADYFSSHQQPNRVCMVMFALKREDAEKKFLKLRKQYTSKSKRTYDMRYLNATEFEFTPVNMGDEPTTDSKE